MSFSESAVWHYHDSLRNAYVCIVCITALDLCESWRHVQQHMYVGEGS